jgi:hypothetical protein
MRSDLFVISAGPVVPFLGKGLIDGGLCALAYLVDLGFARFDPIAFICVVRWLDVF